jgi:hypothetical protein
MNIRDPVEPVNREKTHPLGPWCPPWLCCRKPVSEDDNEEGGEDEANEAKDKETDKPVEESDSDIRDGICTSVGIIITQRDKTNRRCCSTKKKHWHLKKGILYRDEYEVIPSDDFESLTKDEIVIVHYLAKYSWEELQHHLKMADTLFKQSQPPIGSVYHLSGMTWEELKKDATKSDFKYTSTYFKMNWKERLELKILLQCEKRRIKTGEFKVPLGGKIIINNKNYTASPEN